MKKLLALALAVLFPLAVSAAPFSGSSTFNNSQSLSGSNLTGIGTSSLTGISGTPSSTTYLRGDGTWAAIAGTGTVNSGTANQMAYYATTGTAVSGNANITTDSNSDLIASAFIPTGTAVPSLGMYNQSGGTVLGFAAGSTQIIRANTNGLHVTGTGVSLGAMVTSMGAENPTGGGAAGCKSGIDIDFNDGNTANVPGVGIGSCKDNSTLGNGQSSMVFAVNGNTSPNLVEQMRITGLGQIGMGTSAPTGFYRLDVQSNVANQNVMNVQNQNANGPSVIDFHDSASTYRMFMGYSPSGATFSPSTAYIGTVTTDPFLVYTNATEKMRVLSGGAVGIGTATPRNGAILDTNGIIATGAQINLGTKFTTSGCSISATTGGAMAGTYTSGTTGSCAAVITINGATGATAPNGWSCQANDKTTVADLQHQTATTQTTATITGTTISGDVINFSCVGY